MSSSNGTSYTTKSMNGIITIDDGMGVVIGGGEIITPSIRCDNLLATVDGNPCSVFSNGGEVSVGNPNDNVNIGLIDVLGSSISNVSSITSTNSNDSISLFTNITNGIISIGTATTHFFIGNVDFLGSVLNNVLTITSITASDTVSIFQNITTGIINIGTGSSSINIGAINILGSTISSIGTLYINSVQFFGTSISHVGQIYSTSSSDTVGIFLNITSGIINIGSPTTTCNFGTIMVLGSSIISNAISNTIDLFTNITTGIINIGSATAEINVGIIKFLGSSITSNTSADTVNIFNNLTSGSLTIANTCGHINIGTSSSGSFINIGTSICNLVIGSVRILGTTIFEVSSIASTTASDTVSIFSNITTGIINIGSATSNIFIGSVKVIGSIISNVSSITSTAVSDTVDIFSNITTGVINIGMGLSGGRINLGINTAGSVMYIFGGTSNGILNIAPQSIGTVNIANTSAVVSIANSTASGSLNIGYTGTIASSHTVNIATSTTALTTVNVGGSNNNTYLKGNTYFNKPINLNYTSTPNVGQVGYLLPLGTRTNSWNANITTDIYTVSVPAGVWFARANSVFSGGISYLISISSTSAVLSGNSCSWLTITPPSGGYLNCDYIISQTATATWYLVGWANVNIINYDIQFQIIRLA